MMFLVFCIGCDMNSTSYYDYYDYDFDGPEPTLLEQEVLDLVNAERETAGLNPLEWCPGLATLAHAHSQDMIDRQFFCHINPEGDGPDERAKLGQAGSHKFTPIIPPYISVGENIARGFRSPKAVMEAWMNSEHHRENILNPNYTHIGISYCKVAEECSINYVWTQNFATRDPEIIIITKGR